MINKESIEKVINKKFDTLEDKVNNISQLKEYHPSLLNAYGLKNKDILEIINNSGEQSNGYKSMFKFLDFYARLSDPKYKVSDKEIDLHYNYIIHNMFKIIDLYENAAEYCSNKDEEKSLLEIVKKAKKMSIQVEDERTEKVLYIDEFVNFEHMHGSIIPIMFNISDYGNADYWIIKLLDYLRNNTFKITGEIIFNITTTGMPYYNSMIQKGHIAGNRDPVEYFKSNKGITFKIEWMSPDEYLEKSFEIHKELQSKYQNISNLIVKSKLSTYLNDNIDSDLIQEYTERTLEGSKMPMPVLDYDNMSQEGRHRAVVAKQLEVEEIPVLVVRSYEE